MKFYYSDFNHTIVDYFSVLKKREIVYEFLTPLVLSGALFLFFDAVIPHGKVDTFFSAFSSLLVNVFAILVGFTIAAIAIFTTIDHDKIRFLTKLSDRVIHRARITNFHFIYINLIYSALASITMLIFTISSYILSFILPLHFLILFLVFGALHVMLLTIRNITTIYLLFAHFVMNGNSSKDE
jgi:hypothetical protein